MIRFGWIVTCLVALLIGCASDFDPKPYMEAPVGQRHQQVKARIISAGDRTIKGTSNTGAVVGASLGASAGVYSGNSAGDSAAGGIAGALLIGLVGAAIESNATKIDVTEFEVETENGNKMRILHLRTAEFKVGDPVLIKYGSPIQMEKLQ